MKRELKVGVFLFFSAALLTWVTLNIRNLPLLGPGAREVAISFDSAQGIRDKTPVELAGIQVGYVKRIELVDSKRAKVILAIRGDIALQKDVTASVRTKGFLGETFIVLIPGASAEPLPSGGISISGTTSSDINAFVGQLSGLAEDLKAITASVRQNVEGENSRLNRTLENIEVLTANLAHFTERNSQNFDQISANLAQLTASLRDIVLNNRENVDETLDRIANVAQTLDEGKGTLGRLIKDDSTVEKLNDSLDGLNEALGGFRQLKTEVGYHVEYLGTTNDLKHYVNLALKPKPDKFFLFEFVDDPAPDSTHVTEERLVTSGGNTSRVVTETETTREDRFLFSAQVAKTLYDFTLRGGIIESSGGVGVDYTKGPFGLSVSAFDFENDNEERPHLKGWSTVNLTRNFYVMGGVDDFISTQQDPDWFMGAGVRFVDDDIKSLLGSFGSAIKP